MLTSIEAILLTGGQSRRMGQDKSKLLVVGEPLGLRISRLLLEAGLPVTVLGREALPGCSFIPDQDEFAGPLAALASFEPSADLVFVCSCDVPGFCPQLVEELASQIGEFDAAVPLVEGRLQPLCAVYCATALLQVRELVQHGEKRMMSWLARLRTNVCSLQNEDWARNVNTPEQWRAAQSSHSSPLEDE